MESNKKKIGRPRKEDARSDAVYSRAYYHRKKSGQSLPSCVSCGGKLQSQILEAKNTKRLESGLCSKCWRETPEGKHEWKLYIREYEGLGKFKTTAKPFTDAELAKYAKNQARVDSYLSLWRDEQLTLSQIAEREGVSKQAVSQWLNLHPEYRFREWREHQ